MRRYRKPHKIRRKTSIFKRRFFWIFILVLIFFCGSAYLVSFSSFFNIKEIQISGFQKVSTDEIKQLVNEKIIRNFWKFSSKSIFLTNFHDIKSEILKKFPQLASVNFKRDFPNIIVVQAEERKQVAVFCPDLNCYSIDKEGIAFEKIEVIFSDFPRINNIEGKNNFSFGRKSYRQNHSELYPRRKKRIG